MGWGGEKHEQDTNNKLYLGSFFPLREQVSQRECRDGGQSKRNEHRGFSGSGPTELVVHLSRRVVFGHTG